MTFDEGIGTWDFTYRGAHDDTSNLMLILLHAAWIWYKYLGTTVAKVDSIKRIWSQFVEH
jgi:hypothetical protein